MIFLLDLTFLLTFAVLLCLKVGALGRNFKPSTSQLFCKRYWMGLSGTPQFQHQEEQPSCRLLPAQRGRQFLALPGALISARRIQAAALVWFMFLAGCDAAFESARLPGPKPDGRYDNHAYLVDASRMDLSRAAASIVTLITKTTFEHPDGSRIEKELVGNGVVVGEGFVLTVEHSVTLNTLQFQTPYGIAEVEARKVAEERFIRWRGKDYPLQLLYRNRSDDIALLRLPPKVRPPSFPHPFGDSDDLRVGNFVYVLGNPLNLGINVREGIVSALKAPPEISQIEAKGENAFMVSNGLVPGDSGTPVIAIRDGRFELVGISQGTFLVGGRLGWVIRINVIESLLLTARVLPKEEEWKMIPKFVSSSSSRRKADGVENLLMKPWHSTRTVIAHLFSLFKVAKRD